MDDKIETPIQAQVPGADDDFVQAKLNNDPTSITHFKEFEHGLSTLKALKLHYKAVGWAFFFGMSVIGWGYDASVGGTLLGSPQFRKDFGFVDPTTGQYILPARWQSAFNSVTSIGMVFGAMMCGYVADHIGRRGAMACACIITVGAIFLQFFAKSNGVLLAGKIINGLSLGFYWTVAPSYCSEIVPLVLRGAATSGVNLFIALGQLLASGMINAFGARTDSWAYRAPFALQWIFPVILLAGLPFCPESPWYLMRRGRRDAARKVMERLAVRQVDDMEGTLNHMAMTIQVEERMAQNASFAQCFRGVDRRRTLIALGSFTVTQLVGVSFVLGYCTYFFQLAGIKVEDSFKLGLGVSALGIIGNIGSWFICNRYGRRTAYVTGTIALTIDLFLIGILDVVPGYPPGDRWAQAVMTLLYNFIYFFLVGGMAYIIFAEVSSTALKSKTIGLTIAWTNVLSTVINIIIPYMLNPDNGNWRGKAGFFFGGLGLCCSIWAYLFLPETNGRTYDELDIMFHRGVKARDFAKYKIEAEVE